MINTNRSLSRPSSSSGLCLEEYLEAMAESEGET